MKKIDAFVFLCCMCLVFTGCLNSSIVEEEVEVKEEDPVESEGSRITLYIPGAEEVRVYSDASPEENYIENCRVITFNGNFKDSASIKGSDIMNNGNATALLPLLPFKIGDDDTVYVICNAKMSDSPPRALSTLCGKDTAAINEIFKPAKPYYSTGEPLPMSGTTVWLETAASTFVVTLTRAVAKVQIRLGESYQVGGTMLDYEVYGGYPHWEWKYLNEDTCGTIILNYGGASNIMQSSALSANLSNKATGTLPKYNIYGTDDRYMRFMQYEIHNPVNECQTKAIYISEYPNSVKDCAGNQIPIDTFNRSRSFLLLMHFVRDNVIPSEAGSDGSVYAWRLDFYDAQNGIYLDIKRNHTYTFTINKIRSTPYKEDSDGGERMESILNYFPGGQEWQVWDNPGSNIEYTLNVEDDWSKGVFSNGQYAVSVSADTITTDTIPFKIRAIVPDGVDAAQIKVHGFKIVDDNSEVNNQSAIQVTSHTADRGMYVFPADGTTTEVTFEVKDHTLIDDNAYMAIYFGNIRQMIPIKIP